jgi:OmpA-OmpF porin, OOP family
MRQMSSIPQELNRVFRSTLIVASACALLTAGCTTKTYVRSQTAPLVQKTNELDDATAANTRNLNDVDARAKTGISNAQSSADAASQSAQSANQAADQSKRDAQDAVNRANALSDVVSGLDNYKQIGDAAVLFGFNKVELTPTGKQELDQLGAQLADKKSFLLEVTGVTDSVGSSEYNYELSQRRAAAVVQYLASKYSIPPHRFYLIGIGKDKEVATNKTAAGRAQNRRVEVQLLSNDAALTASSQTPPQGH